MPPPPEVLGLLAAHVEEQRDVGQPVHDHDGDGDDVTEEPVDVGRADPQADRDGEHHRHPDLQVNGVARGLELGLDLGQVLGQHADRAHAVPHPGDRVAGGDRDRHHAVNDGDEHEDPAQPPDSPGHHVERVGVGSEVFRLVDAPSDDAGVAREHEEHADQDDRSEDRPRQQAAGIVGLASQWRHRFEPAQRQDREHDPVQDPVNALERVGQVEGRGPVVAVRGRDQEGDRERHHDQQFQRPEQDRGLRRDRDAAVDQHPGQRQPGQGEHPPRDVHSGAGLQHVLGQVAHEPEHGGRSQRVIGEVAPPGEEPPPRAEPAPDERVVAARGRHVLAELRHGVGDEQHDDHGADERDGGGRARVGDDERQREDDAHGRADVRDALEQDVAEAEFALGQACDRLAGIHQGPLRRVSHVESFGLKWDWDWGWHRSYWTTPFSDIWPPSTTRTLPVM